MLQDLGFWSNPWTIGIGTTVLGGIILAIVVGKDRATRSHTARDQNQTGGVTIAGDVAPSGSGSTTLVAGRDATFNAAPSAEELAQAQSGAKRQHELEVREKTVALEACITTIRGDLQAFFSDDPPSNMDGRVESTLDEWKALKPQLEVLDDPRRVEDCEHFFDDVRHELQAMRDYGGPTFAKTLDLIQHAESLLGIAPRSMGALRFPCFELEWNLTRDFWLNSDTLMADQGPSFIRSMVQGPFCLTCKHDLMSALNIGIEGPMECPECGAPPDVAALEGRFGFPVSSSEDVRLVVFKKAQAAVRSGRLLHPAP